MKIAFLSALYPPATRGGGELSTHYIAQGLQHLGHDVTVITEQGDHDTYKIDGVPVVRLPLRVSSKPLRERHATRQVARALREKLAALGHFDVIHAHDFRMALALSELGLPNAFVTNRDYAQICGSTNYLSASGGPCAGCTWAHVWQNHRVAEAAWPRKFFRAWQFAHNIEYRKQAFQKLPRQIFISRSQQEIINRENNLIGIQQTVIYNPVAASYLATPAKPAGQNLLYVGTLEWYKGVGLLLESFRQIVGAYPNLKLRLVGEGADKSKYQALVASWQLENQIEFVGRVRWNRLMPIYDEASIVIAPHIWVEPFGRTVVEAMARGKVVIAANHGGPAEIIKEGTLGFLFEPNSVASLEQTLQQALALPLEARQTIGGRAREWVTSQLTPAGVAKQHIALYQGTAYTNPT